MTCRQQNCYEGISSVTGNPDWPELRLVLNGFRMIKAPARQSAEGHGD